MSTQAAMCLLTTWAASQHALGVSVGNKDLSFEQSPLHSKHGRPDQERPFSLRFLGEGAQSVVEDLAEKLWDGVDLTDGEQDVLMEKAMGEQRAMKAADAAGIGGGSEQVQLLGPQDTGTTLVHITMKLNFPDEANEVSSQVVFKHSLSSAKDLCKRYTAQLRDGNVTVLVTLRSPISQIVSWHKAPHALKLCFEREFDEMGKPCFANLRPEWNKFQPDWNHDDTFKHFPGKSLYFKNSMAVYNRYVGQYKDMLTEPACRRVNVHLIHYEDMVFNPQEVMSNIARKAGWPMPSVFTIVNTPAKQHGHPVGRDWAMFKIRMRSYLEELTAPVRAARCKELDANLVLDDSERSFSDAPIPYLEDCLTTA